LNDQEDLEKVEQPEKAKIVVDLAANDRRQTRGRVEDEIDGRNSQASLVDAEEVSNNRDDERLECAGGESLYNARRKKVFIADFDFTNGRADDAKQRGHDEDWALAISAAECAYEGPDAGNCEDVVTGDQDGGGEVFVDLFRDGEVRGIQERSLGSQVRSDSIRFKGKGKVTHVGGGAQHGPKGENPYNGLFLQERPVERIIWVVARLGGEHNVRVLACTMLEISGL
jgi:hypothetical protein